ASSSTATPSTNSADINATPRSNITIGIVGIVIAVILAMIALVAFFIIRNRRRSGVSEVVDKNNEEHNFDSVSFIPYNDLQATNSVSFIPHNDLKATSEKNQFQNKKPRISYQRSLSTPTSDVTTSPGMNHIFQNLNDPYERSPNSNIYQEHGTNKIFQDGSSQPHVGLLQNSPASGTFVTRKDSRGAKTNKSTYEEGNDVCKSEDERVLVVHPYYPNLTDELQLDVGMELLVIRRFEDGWASGLNPITGQHGLFPAVCVAKPKEAASLIYKESEGI
ncbi:hypothetical protein HDU92_000289, partial [Lobulomyces angularis]